MTTYANSRRQWSQATMEYLTLDQTSNSLNSWARQAQTRGRPPASVWSVQIISSKYNKCNSRLCISNNSNKWWLKCSNSASSSSHSSPNSSIIILVRSWRHPLCNRIRSINKINSYNLPKWYSKYRCNSCNSSNRSHLCQCQCLHQASPDMEACKLTEHIWWLQHKSH